MNNNKVRFYELDLLRFFAAMAVVLFHFLFRGQQSGDIPVTFDLVENAARYGFYGVNLFFMISGFVISLSAVNRSAKQFAISRVTRLYPAFWVGVSLTAALIVLFGAPLLEVDFPQYLVNLTMLAEFVGVKDVDGVYWTLYVELKFYAIVFVILLFNKFDKIEAILSAWLLILLVSLFYPLPRLLNFLVFPEWAPYFISGASYYLLKVKGVGFLRLAILLSAFLLSLNMAAEGITTLNSDYNVQASQLVAVLIVCVFHLIFTLMIFNKLSWFRSPWVIKIGALTYPLYLIHQNIGFMIFTHFSGSINKYLLLIISLSIVLLLAWLIHVKVEKKFGPKLKKLLETHLLINPQTRNIN